MRKLMFFVCVIFILTGCNNVENEQESVEVTQGEVEIFPDNMFVSDEQKLNEFIELYKEALEVYRWFNFSTMELDFERPLQSTNEEHQHLFELKNKNFSTLNDLRNYVSNYFSPELVDDLFRDQQLYKEIHGKLYGAAADRGSSLTTGDREAYKLIKIDEYNYIFRVEVDMVDPENRMNVVGLEIIDYPINIVDNKYIFTQFKDIR